jgi:hypothetical protein
MLWESSVNFLVHPAYSVPIPYFELGELLKFSIEAIIKMRNGLTFLYFLELGKLTLHFDLHVAFEVSESLHQLRMTIFVFAVIAEHVLIEHTKHHFADVEFEAGKEKRR